MQPKKYILIIAALCALQTPIFADNDKPVQFSEIPAQAQTFVKAHFGGKEISFLKMETDWFDKNYKVFFTDGESAEFDRHGDWIEIRNTTNGIPASVLPAPIRAYLQKNYPDSKVLQIDRENKKIEIELSNNLEITFDKNFRVINIDN